MILRTIRVEPELPLLARGRLRAAARFVDPYCREPYRWMAQQLARRWPPPRGCRYPLWAWAARPDLRGSAHLPRGTRGGLLEVELPEAQVLLSDFERWHAALSRHYLAASSADERAFDRRLRAAGLAAAAWPLPEPFASEVRRSWERIFAFDRRSRSPRYWGPREGALVQAVFWELRPEQVRSRRGFVAR